MLNAMTLGHELQKALDQSGLTPSDLARVLGHRNSGLVHKVLKDARPLPEKSYDKAVEILGLNTKGREKQRETFMREALLAWLPEQVRPMLRKEFSRFDQLERRANAL